MNISPEKFIITSNYTPDQLYGNDKDLLEAIKQRFDPVHITGERKRDTKYSDKWEALVKQTTQ